MHKREKEKIAEPWRLRCMYEAKQTHACVAPTGVSLSIYLEYQTRKRRIGITHKIQMELIRCNLRLL